VCSTITEVLGWRDRSQITLQNDFSVVTFFELKLIMNVEKLKYSLQLVIPVTAPADNSQHQVQFCRCGVDSVFVVHAS
jgi:hypothetical protein